MKKPIIPSGLLEVGGKFKVTEEGKDTIYTQGSCGFMYSLNGIDNSYQNVARVEAVMTRRGKGGKARLEQTGLTMPVFYPPIEKKEYKENFAKLMPDEKKRGYVIVERDLDMCSHIVDMDPLDFMGYAAAISLRLQKMSKRCRHSRWPEEKANPVRVMIRTVERFEQDPDAYLLDMGESLAFREQFVNAARRMSSAMAKIQLEMEKEKVYAETHAAEFLRYVNSGEFLSDTAENKKNEYVFTDDNKILENTLEFYKNLLEELKYKITKSQMPRSQAKSKKKG